MMRDKWVICGCVILVIFTGVIDPGHGGEDSGKIGINQAQEKDLNLIIAQKVKKILEGKEYIVVMTRTTDTGMDPENHREMKDNDSYYLLRRTQNPTIIVECGFLSNASEADKLVDDEYQNQLAEAIARGIEMYFTRDK